MPNLVGIGNSQVPTNAMLGGLAYQDPAHANLTEVEIENIAAIKAKTADTATDIFVYDTRKDSDGGAWRNRTQGTSWYNESVGTYRGARKEFPAVAVIVTSSSALTIYDADDPNMSMWMIFVNDNAKWLKHTTSGPKSVVAMNGVVVSCGAGGAGRLSVVNFVSDDGYVTEAGYTYRHDWIETRNSTAVGPTDGGTRSIINNSCHDVAITVLPNAPIDVSTGLPIPTIAVGTDDGVSVIKDDGTIVCDITNSLSGYNVTTQIEIDEKYVYIGFGLSNGYVGGIGYAVPIPSGNVSLGNITAATSNADFRWSSNSTSGSGGQSDYYINPSDANTDDVTGTVLTKRGMSFGTETGVSMILNEERDTNGSVAYVTKDFNTGWMHGDIKGAWLASTDDTDISADTLQAESHSTLDSTFATSNGWTVNSDWTISGGVASCDGQNNGRWIYPNANTFPIGSSVAVEVEVTAYTGGTLYVSYGTGAATSGTNMASTNGGVPFRFVGECTGNQIVYLRSDSFIGSIDNVKMYIAEEDRSVINTGLAVVGTIAKTPVATGAELVSYDSLTSSNYLEQQYNSDLNFGTDDFCIMGWFYDVGNNSSILYRLHNSTTVGVGYIVATSSGGELGYSSYTQGFRSTGRITHYTSDTWNGKENWNMFVCGKKDGNGFMYVNGVLKQTSANANSHTDTTYNPPLRIGNNQAGTGTIGGGKLALIRISSGFPSEEQIKKIYNDEKLLFHKNAKCTLYGTSDAVVALAYDDSTDTVYAGTSAGRSDFSGLTRINNTTTAVTTAIAVSNELVAEQ